MSNVVDFRLGLRPGEPARAAEHFRTTVLPHLSSALDFAREAKHDRLHEGHFRGLGGEAARKTAQALIDNTHDLKSVIQHVVSELDVLEGALRTGADNLSAIRTDAAAIWNEIFVPAISPDDLAWWDLHWFSKDFLDTWYDADRQARARAVHQRAKDVKDQVDNARDDWARAAKKFTGQLEGIEPVVIRMVDRSPAAMSGHANQVTGVRAGHGVPASSHHGGKGKPGGHGTQVKPGGRADGHVVLPTGHVLQSTDTAAQVDKIRSEIDDLKARREFVKGQVAEVESRLSSYPAGVAEARLLELNQLLDDIEMQKFNCHEQIRELLGKPDKMPPPNNPGQSPVPPRPVTA